MDIERLKELKVITELLYQDGIVLLTYCDDVIELIDEAIARQSVKSEEVQEAIELFDGAIKYRKDQEEEVKKHYGGKLPDFYLDLNRKEALAITALQAYEPKGE